MPTSSTVRWSRSARAFRAAGLALGIAALASACVKPEPRRFEEFMEDSIAREGTLARCNQMREETMGDIECANARRAAAAIALQAERTRREELERESERKLAALRAEIARRDRAKSEAMAAALAAAEAAYEAQWANSEEQTDDELGAEEPAAEFGAPLGAPLGDEVDQADVDTLLETLDDSRASESAAIPRPFR